MQAELMKETPWFVAQLRPHGLRAARDHLHRQGFETFAPTLTASSLRAGGKSQASKPLFPGYLFVGFDPADPGWIAINSTRGVSRLILTDPRKPRPLSAHLMAGLIARCDGAGVILPPDDLAIGDRIRVLAGPFADLVTTIETLPDQARIGVLIDIMGRSVKTSVPRAQIEKLG
jgi:transcriptional antiterminator RfaH